MILTLEEAKRHLRVDLDYTDDDMYIEELIDMSEIDIANRLKFDSLTDVFSGRYYTSSGQTCRQACRGSLLRE